MHSFMPTQVRKVLIPLLDKPGGGFRPIGFFCSPYRLWARCRRPVLDEWEQRNSRAYFASARGRSPVDAVWKHAANPKVAVNSGQEPATLLWDLRKLYEPFDHALLIKRGLASGMPPAMLKVCVRMYQLHSVPQLGPHFVPGGALWQDVLLPLHGSRCTPWQGVAS